MIKLVGISAILICTSMAGFSLSDKLKARVNELNQINYMLEEIEILIRYKAMTVYEIIENLKQNQSMKNLGFLQT